MARYEVTGKPQQAQTTNVGQFGPSVESLQDWRSVFTAAAEVKKIAEDLVGVRREIQNLIEQAKDVVRIAEAAVTVATEINESTIENVEVRWGQIGIIKQEIDAIAGAASDSAILSGKEAGVSQENADITVNYTQDAAILKREMQEIRDDIVGLQVGLSLTRDGPARAEFDSATNHLQLYVPKLSTSIAGSIDSVCGKRGPYISLNADDVGALPNSGDIPIRDKLSFDCGEGRQFELDAIMAPLPNGSVDPQFSISYQYTGIKNNKHGLILDKIGNGAFGGELYVKNTDDPNTKKRVYHEGYKPTAVDVGAMPLGSAYTKDQVYKVSEVYAKQEVDNKITRKIDSNPLDGQVYVRQNANWIPLSNKYTLGESERLLSLLETAVNNNPELFNK